MPANSFVQSGNSPPAVPRKQRRLEATAHHEAGHAVICHAVGATFQKLYTKYLQSYCSDLVNRHWCDITRVAEALMEKKTLTRAEVIDLIAPLGSPRRAS